VKIISDLSGELLASQEGLCSLELASLSTTKSRVLKVPILTHDCVTVGPKWVSSYMQVSGLPHSSVVERYVLLRC
jgi:hypothetical protein